MTAFYSLTSVKQYKIITFIIDKKKCSYHRSI